MVWCRNKKILSPSDYLGLYQRYARLLGDTPQTSSLSKEQEQVRKQLSELFDGMMHTLYSQEGGENGAFPPTRDGCIHSLSMRKRG